MKTLRYLLMVIVVAIASATAQAQPKAQFKNSQNQPAFSTQYVPTTHYVVNTTSTLMESGSSLPMAARNGVTIGANTPDDNTPSGGVRGPRRAKAEDDPFGGQTIDDTSDPLEPGSPVGEGMWILLLMAMCYAFGKWRYQMTWRIMARRSSGEE